MNLSTLPEGARLALLHWPWGTPTSLEITDAAGCGCDFVARHDCLDALLSAGLIEDAPAPTVEQLRRFRLTQAGRRAVDAIQSGEAGQ